MAFIIHSKFEDVIMRRLKKWMAIKGENGNFIVKWVQLDELELSIAELEEILDGKKAKLVILNEKKEKIQAKLTLVDEKLEELTGLKPKRGKDGRFATKTKSAA